MRITSFQVLSAAVIIAASAIGVQAANPTTLTPSTVARQKATAASPEVKTLRSALELLRGADHDYKGHRAIAMRKIEEACHILNGKPIVGVKGNPPTAGVVHAGVGIGSAGKQAGQKTEKPELEPQATSDAQLKQAQGIVQEVLSSIPSGTQPEVTTLLTEAVSELGTALTVK